MMKAARDGAAGRFVRDRAEREEARGLPRGLLDLRIGEAGPSWVGSPPCAGAQ